MFLVFFATIYHGLQLQRIILFSKLDINVMDGNFDSGCCTADIIDSEVEIELLEKCFEGASSLNSIEKSTLYYICGYVARKENIVSSDRDTATYVPASEFTINLSRGSSSLPPINLFDLSLYYYAFFQIERNEVLYKDISGGFRVHP